MLLCTRFPEKLFEEEHEEAHASTTWQLSQRLNSEQRTAPHEPIQKRSKTHSWKMHTQTYRQTQRHTDAHTDSHTHTQTDRYMDTRTHGHRHTQTNTDTDTDVQSTFTHTHTNTHTHALTHAFTHMHSYTHTLKTHTQICRRSHEGDRWRWLR